MLAVTTYDQGYIDACRARVDAQIAAYHDLATAGRNGDGTLGSAIDAFEPQFFNHMVLALDQYFVHRQRGMEGKDGNPINEVRVLGNSIKENGGALAADKTIRLKAEASVLGYEPGDEIRIAERDFQRLADGYFAEIEKRFT
jgi:hypothetical protein